MSLYLKTAKVGTDIKKALREIASFDADFNGENGVGYLWSEVWKENGYEDEDAYNEAMDNYLGDEEAETEEPELKYESNIEYLLDTLEGTDEEIAVQFIRTWMDHDSGYYTDFDYDIVANDKGIVSFIALAVIS